MLYLLVRTEIRLRTASLMVGVVFTLVILLAVPENSVACDTSSAHTIPQLNFPPRYQDANPKADYIYRLLALALIESEQKYGPCDINLQALDLPVKRVELLLETNKLFHAVALTATRSRDARLLPISIPLTKGLIGFRIFLINSDDKQRFAKIKTLDDLRKYTAGQGLGWTDVEILQRNNLPVVTSGNTYALAGMLIRKRFDYFPRGALEIADELGRYGDRAIVAEKTIVLNYPNMTTFYVNKKNTKLAERLEFGLKKAHENGSFNKLYYNTPEIKQALAQLNLKGRKVLQVCNPYLPAWVPIHIDAYWLSPWPKDLQSESCTI